MPILKHACSLCGCRAPRVDCPRCGGIQLSLFEAPPPPVPDDAETVTIAELAEAGRRERSAHAARLERLRMLGREIRVGLVGCAKVKREHPAKCRDLYRSPLFVASLAHVERTCDESFVVSAAHGLIPLDETVAPYDRTLRDLPKKERLAWGNRIAGAIQAHFERLPLALVVLAGLEYADPIRGAARPRGWTFEAPLARLTIGQRLAWLKAQVPPPTSRKRLRGRA